MIEHGNDDNDHDRLKFKRKKKGGRKPKGRKQDVNRTTDELDVDVEADFDDLPEPLLDRARALLALAARPKSLSCRERERILISNFLEESVRGKGKAKGRIQFIAGTPGTGKTATVHEVVRGMRERSRKGKLPEFDFVEVNGAKLQSPQHIYTAVLYGLTGEKLSPDSALNELMNR